MSESRGVADPNAADQAAAWNGAMGERWLAYHRGLDRMLSPFGTAVVDAAGDLTDSMVLDIGCGTGETTAELAARVGSEGHVVGLDISELLIAHARSTHASSRLEFVVADAAAYEPSRPVDLIASRFGTMFFPDPATTFARLASCLAPGGRLAMVVWQAPIRNEWVHRPFQAAASVIELPPPPPAGSPGPFSLSDSAAAEQLLATAGFAEVNVTACEREISIGADPETTARFLLNVLPTGPLLDSLGHSESHRLVETVAAALDDTPAVTLGAAANLITART